jgi:hypothetical protein
LISAGKRLDIEQINNDEIDTELMMIFRDRIMVKLPLLLAAVLVCSALAGCSDDAPGSTNNDADLDVNQDATDGSDAGDPDSDDNDSDGDVGPVECQTDEDCSEGANRAGFCDTDANRCIFVCDDGFGDCNGDPADGCEVDLTTNAAHCGACGEICTPNSLHFEPICLAEGDAAPGCDINPEQCEQGFADLNADPADGCECEIVDPADPIDPDGFDSNCDGVDGILAQTIFVAPGGDDTAENAGLTPQAPMATLDAALQKAVDEGRSVVLAAGGDYPGVMTLENGVSIYGGFVADDFSRDLANQTTRIIASAGDFDENTTNYVTVLAEDITDPTVLDNLTIVGFDAVNPGASTLALRAVDSAGLTVQNSRIIGGAAANGAPGEPGQTRACTPPAGGDGGIADNDAMPCMNDGYDDANADDGDPGALADSSQGTGLKGFGGHHQCGATASSEGQADEATDGVDGKDGTPGEAGAHGVLPADGAIGAFDEAGVWSPAAGVEPTAGGDGGGGGGGGAGGNYESMSSVLCTPPVVCFYLGGNGGDGGDGGCGGEAGENGQAGGSSFGIVVIGEAIGVAGTTIELGDGGDGGDGGSGGNGESGSRADNSETGANGANAGNGGFGGFGGIGGDGGNGVGGQGGNAIGLATVGVEVDDAGVTYRTEAAAAGSGGNATAPAEGGRDGVVETLWAF